MANMNDFEKKTYFFNDRFNYLGFLAGTIGILVLIPIGIILKIFPIGALGFFFFCPIFYSAFKIEKEGIILNTVESVLSYPKPGIVHYFIPTAYITTYPRQSIPLASILQVKWVNTIELNKNKLSKGYELIVSGHFGSKKFSFHDEETRDQLYALISSINNSED